MIDLTPIARFALLLVRPGMIVAIAPALGGMYVPAPVKIGLTVLLAIGLLPSVPVTFAKDVALTIVIAREAVIGLALAFVARALIAGAELAGHLSGQQIGFSYGATVDPASGVRSTILTTLYGSLAILAFFAINGHHALLRALAASYAGLPIGAGHVDSSIVAAVRQTLGLVFTTGIRLAAPVVIVLLIVELLVGLISRAAPALNFMVIGYPLRLIVGLFVVGLVIPAIPAVTASLTDQTIALAARLAAAFR